ncbi:MAG: hypothetical protein H6574_09040 [Lewinellaceae bacterium]|nr:hypothetical protein [Lewinellaceae bacterium]
MRKFIHLVVMADLDFTRFIVADDKFEIQLGRIEELVNVERMESLKYMELKIDHIILIKRFDTEMK